MGRAASFVSELRRGWHTVRLETLKPMSHTPRMPHHHPCSPFVEHQRRSWGRSSAICVQVPRRRKTSSSRSAEVKLYFDKFESGHHEIGELARGRGETRLASCPALKLSPTALPCPRPHSRFLPHLLRRVGWAGPSCSPHVASPPMAELMCLVDPLAGSNHRKFLGGVLLGNEQRLRATSTIPARPRPRSRDGDRRAPLDAQWLQVSR
jgi:hypothetical protein